METESMVQLRGVVKEYPLGKLKVRALDGVDLCIRKGEFTVVAGPSGSGKTTLLNMVGCVDVPTAGEVLVAGQDTSKLDDRGRTLLRLERLGFIFQTFNLIPVLTAAQNVEFPLLLQRKLGRRQRRDRVREMLTLVGLEALLDQRPNEMSGGQRQRVAIARALVTLPGIVLADEPTANLDTATGMNIIDLMKTLNRERQTTFIFSTHDPRVMEHARRIVRIVDGRIAGDDGCGGAARRVEA
jgi:putative ABC transport system ATP-binding protein